MELGTRARVITPSKPSTSGMSIPPRSPTSPLGKHHLQQVFKMYSDIVNNSNSPEDTRKQLQDLQCHIQSLGLYGPSALDLLLEVHSDWRWETMDSAAFGMVYRFAFWISRDAGKRNLPVDRALSAWRMLLNGRFRLLERWLSFVRADPHILTVTEDTWRQVLDFTRSVLGDLSNYDPSGAWPVLLDDFVEDFRQSRLSSRRQHSHANMNFGPAGIGMVAVSPAAGSKRRSVDVDGVACMLAQMPLGAVDDDANLCGAAKRLRLESDDESSKNGMDKACSSASGMSDADIHQRSTVMECSSRAWWTTSTRAPEHNHAQGGRGADLSQPLSGADSGGNSCLFSSELGHAQPAQPSTGLLQHPCGEQRDGQDAPCRSGVHEIIQATVGQGLGLIDDYDR